MKYPSHIILDMQNRYLREQYHNYTLLQSSKNKLPRTHTKTLNLYTYSTKAQQRVFLSRLTQSKSFSLNWITLYDINFLRKEKIYTKLKYSRCPQYDIISGGFAAIFAGFIGFLISEKFGIELVDSGDFYIAFMYGVFSVFSIRPLLRIYSITSTPYAPHSLKYGILFWLDVLNLTLKVVKQTLSKFFSVIL